MNKINKLLALFLIVALMGSISFATKKKRTIKKKRYVIGKKVKINWPKEKAEKIVLQDAWLGKVKLPKVGQFEVGARFGLNGGGASNVGLAMLYGVNEQVQAEIDYYSIAAGYNISVAGLYTFNGDTKVSYYTGGGFSQTTAGGVITSVIFGLGGIRYIYDPKVTLISELHIGVTGGYTIVLGVNYAL